jgi:hypothetical protein
MGWLEAQAAGGQLEAALMLPIYFLLRGRTPEALHAYATHCPRTPTTQQQLDLVALLTEAARTLPAPQRALIVQQRAAPALATADGSTGSDGGSAGVALTGGLPALAGDVAPALLSVGPSPGQAPLVGSIPVLLEQQRLAAAAAATSTAARVAAEAAGSERQVAGGGGQQAQPMLFGQQGSAGARGSVAAAPSSSFFGNQAGTAAGAGEELPLSGAFAGAGGGGGASGHEFDRVLGLSPAPMAAAAGQTPGGGAKGKRRWGGSAYR